MMDIDNRVKGPFKNYVILLGGGGQVTKILHKITRGEGGTPLVKRGSYSNKSIKNQRKPRLLQVKP